MRRLVFAILVLSLLLALVFVQKEIVLGVKAPSSIRQGDLVLTDNNVTTIEGRFDINGNIIVEENATLYLKNAVLNFTQSKPFQFRMAVQNPLNGNPRLMIENATITSEHRLYVNFHGNASVIGDNLNSTYTIVFFAHDDSFISLSNSSFRSDFLAYDSSIITMSDSSFNYLVGYDYSSIAITDCVVNSNLNVYGNSTVDAVGCTIYNVNSEISSVNCSIDNLQSGIVSYWNLRLNSSVILSPTGWTPNITLLNSQVSRWSFSLTGSSNVTISNSRLGFLQSFGSSSTSIYNSTTGSWIVASGFSTFYLYDTIVSDSAVSSGDAAMWFVNSTCYSTEFYDSGRIYVGWYLDVHVVDFLGQDVPSANATATYPNITLAESKLTDADGRVRLTLLEKMMNVTGEYPIGNYTVEAMYDVYSASTSINMTGNKQITLKLEDFIIPEFPSPPVLLLSMMASLLTVIIWRRKRAPKV